ncbi:hypothetical protein BGP75_13185 [Motiliproteus sp. MSK22-1]|nr:hypothetical protein BGP75_13185 [Motiliproteus sp. MSK22-1]
MLNMALSPCLYSRQVFINSDTVKEVVSGLVNGVEHFKIYIDTVTDSEKLNIKQYRLKILSLSWYFARHLYCFLIRGSNLYSNSRSKNL